MSTMSARRHCKTCNQQRLFQKEKQNNVMHLVLSIVTVGVWVPVWLLIAIAGAFKPYRCSVCGQSKM